MDNEDIIEVMTEQIGGNGKCNTAPTHLYEHDVPSKGVSTRAGTPEDTIHIAVEYRAQNGLEREIRCKMTKTMSFDKFVDLHSKHWGVDPSAQHLTYNGKTVFLSDTPAPVSHAPCGIYPDRRALYAEQKLTYLPDWRRARRSAQRCRES